MFENPEMDLLTHENIRQQINFSKEILKVRFCETTKYVMKMWNVIHKIQIA